MAKKYGIFVEPACAAAYAGFLHVTDKNHFPSPPLKPSDRVVIMLTGHGLKDPKSAAMGVGYVSPVPPSPSPSPSSSSSSPSPSSSMDTQSVCVVDPSDLEAVRLFAKKWDLL
jgi:threonine synthase